jgi:hypothetical protein
MTVIVSVKINDGIVMATDSVTSYASGITYQHAIKIVNLVKGLPIGAMVTGNGGIGNESIETLLKDLRQRFQGEDAAYPTWKVDPNNYTMESIVTQLREFIWTEKAQPQGAGISMQIRVCGYSSGRPLPEVWDVEITDHDCLVPKVVQAETHCGLLWAGDYEAINRLVLGVPGDLVPAVMTEFGMSMEDAIAARDRIIPHLYHQLVMSSMPIQDAIDLARFLVETTAGYVKFALNRGSKTVGGPIEIAAITKHEGYKWVQRKHFYRKDLNP